MYNPMNTTIFDPSESSTCTVIKDLVSYVIRGRNKDNTPKNIFKALVEEDMNHTGYLALEAFERVFSFLEIKIDRFINVFRRRYEDSSQEGRINITSLLYDMYNIKRTSPEILGQFPDFPPKPPVDKDKCLVNLSEILKRKGFQADTFVAKLVEFGKSNRVRIPHILAKVYESCWESFTDRSQPREDRLPLQKVFDIVDCLDTPKIGSMMDHQLSSILNSYFQMEIMLFYRTLLIKLQEQKSDLRAFVTKAMTGNEIAQVERLRSHLLAERFSADSVNKVFKRIGLEGVKEVPLAVLQQKIEKDMLLLGICDKPESTRQYIYGESSYSRESAAEQGVELVIAQMHEGFQASGRDFYTVFNYPTNQLVSRDYFLTTLLKLGVTHHIEREKLIFLCKDKRDPSAISLSTLKAIYDSRFGLGGSNTVSQKQIEMTIKKLRETIRAMGFSVSILFTRADSNQTGSIDRGELFFLLLKLDEGIRKDEANAIFDQIDRDRSGTISQTEFENFFQAEASSLGGNIRLEKVRWAQHIFGEITVRLEEKG
jgi:Ca2+-binding EF-hand superfamily protein